MQGALVIRAGRGRCTGVTGGHVLRRSHPHGGPAATGALQLKKPPVTGMPGEAAVQDSVKTGSWQKRLA